MKTLYLILTALWLGQSTTAKATDKWDDFITKHSVVKDFHLVKSILVVESSGDPQAVSAVGAKGLMQLTRIAILDIVERAYLLPKACSKVKLGLDLFDPVENIRAGSCYLSLMFKDMKTNEVFAIAAYNAGPTTVNRFIHNSGNLPLETKNYIIKVYKELNRLQN